MEIDDFLNEVLFEHSDGNEAIEEPRTQQKTALGFGKLNQNIELPQVDDFLGNILEDSKSDDSNPWPNMNSKYTHYISNAPIEKQPIIVSLIQQRVAKILSEQQFQDRLKVYLDPNYIVRRDKPTPNIKQISQKHRKLQRNEEMSANLKKKKVNRLMREKVKNQPLKRKVPISSESSTEDELDELILVVHQEAETEIQNLITSSSSELNSTDESDDNLVEENEYERQRLENIRKNNEKLIALGLIRQTESKLIPKKKKKN